MTDWLDHLIHDPMTENPWSLALLMLGLAVAVGPLIVMWARDTTRRRRKQETTVTEENQPAETNDEQDPQAGQRAAAMAELPGDEVQPLRGADVYRDLPTIDAELEERWRREGIVDSGPITTPRLFGSAPVPQPVISQAREACVHCEGRGYVPGVNDLLNESLALLGDQGDEVIRAFYSRLFMVAPEVASLFPADITEALSPAIEPAEPLHPDRAAKLTAGRQQRDRLLAALVALADLYDPSNAEKMGRLDAALERFGRAHAAFVRKDGTIKGATWEEYGAVKDALFTTLVRTAQDAWKAEYTEAWSLAYDYAAAGMVSAQQRSGFTAPRFPRQG